MYLIRLGLVSRSKNSKKIKRHLWKALNNTMWAFKAEKGSEFIAAHRPGPYSRQQMAENNGLPCAERVREGRRLALWMILLRKTL